MKTNNVMLRTLIVMLLCALAAGTAFAQQQDRVVKKDRIKKVRMMYKKMNHMPRIPNLSEDQKEEIKTIMLNAREEVMPLQNQLNEKRARLKTLRTADEVDIDAINGVVDEVNDLRAEIMKQRLTSEQDVRRLLTDEQRVVFDSRKMRLKHQHGFRRHAR